VKKPIKVHFIIAIIKLFIQKLISMKKLLTIATALLVTVSAAQADIQSPPGAQYDSTRKLGRAVANILYGFSEIPEQIVRKNDKFGSKAGWSWGLVAGTQKSFQRMGYGFYELFTFRCPTYRGTFRPPYEKCGTDYRIEMNPSDGLSEFPPELGAESFFDFSRTQNF